MVKYILSRISQAALVLIGVTLVTFLLLNVIPGDPVSVMLDKVATPQAVENLRREWGLDKPLPVQYCCRPARQLSHSRHESTKPPTPTRSPPS